MPTTTKNESSVQDGLIVITKLAYGAGSKSEEYAASEKKYINDAVNYAVKYNISRKDVIAAFEAAGYSHKRASVYATKINVVQRDPQVKEQVIKGEIRFEDASRTARENKKTEDPDKSSDMLRGFINNAAKWAVKTKLPKEDFLNRCDIAYNKAEVLY